MAEALPPQVAELLADPRATRVLITTDEDGAPRPLVTDFLELAPDGAVLYFEPLESSRANKNLVRAIWFDRRIALALSAPDGRRFRLS